MAVFDSGNMVRKLMRSVTKVSEEEEAYNVTIVASDQSNDHHAVHFVVQEAYGDKDLLRRVQKQNRWTRGRMGVRPNNLGERVTFLSIGACAHFSLIIES